MIHLSPLRRALAPALAVAVLLALLPGVATAGTIEAGQSTVRTNDPNAITFSVRVRASAGLESATLRYTVLNPGGNIGGSGVATFSPGAETDVTFELQTRTRERYIPVGSDFVFSWQLRDRDGVTHVTEQERYTFMDGRYQWQSRTEDGVTVFWYGNNDDHAVLALRATRAALNDTGALLDAEVPYPVKVMVWRNDTDGALAMRPRGAVFEQMVITGGQRVAPDLLFVFAPNVDVIRHEAAHIVTHVAGDGPFTSLPSWLDEGVAVYMQNSVGGGYMVGLQFAIQSDTVMPLRSMQSPSNNPDQVNAFYGQSWSTVKFMIDEWGREKFVELFRLAREGNRIDTALEAVYGFDQDGLYNLWREANGLRPIEFTPRASGTAAPAVEATRAPLSIPTPVSRPGSQPAAPGGDGTGTTTQPGQADTGRVDNTAGMAIVVGGGALLVAVLLGAAGVYLARRRA